MIFPKLFKRTSTGALQEWEISVVEKPTVMYLGNEKVLPHIITRYGQVGGAIQESDDTVSQGKNVGKANETTPLQQAEAEAQSKWEKQLKSKGYVQTIEEAEAGDRDALVEGGIDPMLAQKYKDHAAKIHWPAYVQPKLDGSRCIAVVKAGVCTLWTRTRKPINSLPHINRAVEQLAKIHGLPDLILDGENYHHDFKNDFEKIMHFVRQKTPIEGHEIVQYHVYDMVLPGSFEDRSKLLWELLDTDDRTGPLKLVETQLMRDEDEMLAYFEAALVNGYEGCMVRNVDSKYEHKRSYGLQKVKEMQDEEYPIIGLEEGRGKMAGKAIFNCKAENGDTFAVKMKGRLTDLEKYVRDQSLAVGKLLTVQFQNKTAYGIPRFPVGLRIRDSVDF